MIFTHEAYIPLSADDVHLNEWLFNLSEKDNKACARGHHAVGTSGGAQFEGMVNVESMAGALIIQHYKNRTAGGKPRASLLEEKPSLPDASPSLSPTGRLGDAGIQCIDKPVETALHN